MKKLISIATVVVLSALVAGAQVASHAPTIPVKAQTQTVAAIDRPVVRVNGTVLTDRDLLRQMMIVFPYARQHGGKFPKEMEADIRRNALDQLVFEELVYQEALRHKMTVPAAKLNQAMDEFRKQFNSPEEYQDYLKVEMGGSNAKLREKVQRAILIDQVLNGDISNRSRMKNPEVRKFYDNNHARFTMPESVQIQTISFLIPDNTTPAQKAVIRKKADEAWKQAKATKDYEGFGMLAEKVSEDDWRVMMGDHKTIHRGRMPPQVEKVVFTMQPGQISDVIETENSFCITRLNARDDAKLMPYDKIAPKLKQDLESAKADELRKSLEARLRQNAKIEMM